MTIVAGGDSHIWGSELADCPHGGPDGYSRKTFSALLAGERYVCAAYPGIGNREIVKRTKKICEQSEVVAQLVIVSWTWPNRDRELNADPHIIELQDFLQLHNIPYIFTCADNCVVSNNLSIDWDHWYLFPPGTEANETLTPRGFYQWAVENKYSVGVDGHPLEQAHHDAAELIKEKFNELVKKSDQ
jgi:hypothetical protein